MSEIKLHILSPEGPLVRAKVELVTLPGVAGPFTVLWNHAALITALEKGNIRYIEGGEEKFLPIREGFVEVGNNEVKVCVEV